MPLSEHEQRLLEQLERQLNDEDPAFAQSMHSESSSRAERSASVRHVVLGIVIAVLGLAGVLAGVASKLIIVGVVGFLLMGVGVYIATTKRRGSPAGSGSKQGRSTSSTPKNRAGSSSFMQRLERKWEERGGAG